MLMADNEEDWVSAVFDTQNYLEWKIAPVQLVRSWLPSYRNYHVPLRPRSFTFGLLFKLYFLSVLQVLSHLGKHRLLFLVPLKLTWRGVWPSQARDVSIPARSCVGVA